MKINVTELWYCKIHASNIMQMTDHALHTNTHTYTQVYEKQFNEKSYGFEKEQGKL